MKTTVRRMLGSKPGQASLHIARQFGVNPLMAYRSLRGLAVFRARRDEFLEQAARFGHEFGPITFEPYFGDHLHSSGSASGHYFHQDLLVARRVFENGPTHHVDVGSRVDGFVAHVASFREIEVFDVRSQESCVRNVQFRVADVSDERWELADYCDSISSLHAVEHIGLGRYGDPVKYFGHLVALDNIWRTLRPGGKFYFSVPVGRQRIAFDGQRVFSLKYLVDLMQVRYEIDRFSYVGDDGALYEDVQLDPTRIESNCGCEDACAIFELTKR